MAARGSINAKGEAVPQPVKVQRYWPGKAPEGVDEYSSEEEEDNEQYEQFEKEDTELITDIQRVDISEKEVATDRRLRRLKEAKETSHSEVVDRKRRYYEEEEQAAVKSESKQDLETKEGAEEDAFLRRQRLRERALEQRRQEEERLKALEEADKAQSSPQEEKEEDDEESSEYETDSEDEDQSSRKLLKPVFIPKAHRETILERERTEKLVEEEEAKRLKELEERRKESHVMVAEVVQREAQKEVEEESSDVHEVDDTDGIDEQAEYEEWKLRELKRIKRDREEREAREKERAEIERRRNMPEEQRVVEDMERIKKQKEEKPKGQYKFLQKYYHKGAFYLNNSDDILKRNYTEPTPDEAVHKELLPKVMQVKNFGRAGQTKWTHLVDQDTSKKDTAWNQKTLVNKSIISKMGGMHGGFDKPTSKKRKTG